MCAAKFVQRWFTVVALLAILTGTASAATVRVEGDWSVFRAAPGESNRLDVYPDESEEGAVFRETGGGRVEAEPPCGAQSTPDAEYGLCPYAATRYAQGFAIYLGDKADVLDNRMFETWTDGGRGNDLLYGSEYSDYIYGGGDQDRLYGGAAEDKLGDRDIASGVGSDADFLAGGPGTDYVDYSDRGREQPVVVDLARGRAGPDTLVSFHGITGGRGDDILRGNARGNFLTGGGGADTLVGQAGHDSLSLSAGGTVDAGPGDDDVEVRTNRGPPTNISCGPGFDLVTSRPTDRLHRSCDVACVGGRRGGCERFDIHLRARARVERGQLVFDVRCQKCAGRVKATVVQGRVLGRAQVRENGPREVRFRLSHGERVQLRRGLEIRLSSPSGPRGFTMVQRG